MIASTRGRARSTRSTAGSMSRATTPQATTQPNVRWAASNTSASTIAVTTAPTRSAAEPALRPTYSKP